MAPPALLAASFLLLDLFGHGLLAPGDLTGDGVTDLLVADPHGAGRLRGVGDVHLLCGECFALVWSARGESVGDAFGSQLACVGDLNGDSVLDVVVASGSPDARRRPYLIGLCGTDGERLFKHYVDEFPTGYNSLVALPGATPETPRRLAVGSWELDGGRVELLEPPEWCPLWTAYGDETVMRFGRDIALAPGGRLFVRAHTRLRDGPVVEDRFLLDAETGATHATLVRLREDGGLGDGSAWAGDVDGDGHEELALGSPKFGGGGSIRVYDGRLGTHLHTWRLPASTPYEGSTQFGDELLRVPDHDGDGWPELLVSAPWSAGAGSALYLVSLNQEQPLRRVVSPGCPDFAECDHPYFGVSLALLDDLDDDGIPEIAAGSGHWRAQGSYDGAVTILRGRDLEVLHHLTRESLGGPR